MKKAAGIFSLVGHNAIKDQPNVVFYPLQKGMFA